MIDLDPQRTLSDAASLREEEGLEPAIQVEAGSFADVSFPEDVDEIIIDVGTADLASFKQAIMVADRILIPVTPSQADVWSTQRFVDFIFKNTHGHPPESITFLNRADTSKSIHATDEAAAALEMLPGVHLAPQRLSNRSAFRDSFSEGRAVFELEPRSVASREFLALVEPLFGRGHHSVLDRLQKQKVSTAADPAFGQALVTPSEKLAMKYRESTINELPGPAKHIHWHERREDEEQWSSAAAAREDKADQGKKGKKGKKIKKGSKGKKGKKGK